ncbi:MAG: TolC family protein [Candidatus Eisenbacteria bacterium]
MQACSSRGKPNGAALVRVALVCVVLAVSFHSAQARVYTLDECIEIALTENTTLARAREDLQSARANVLSSWSSVLPHVSAGLSQSGRTDVVEGEDSTSESFGGSLSLSQTLLDGASFARIAGAHRGRTATELSLEDKRRRTVFETKQGYYGLLRAVQLRGVQEEAVELGREQLRKTQSLFDLGSASKSDLLKAQVQVGEAELALIAAEKSAATARAGLAFILGIDVTTEIEAVDTPEDRREEEVTSYDMETAISSRPDIRAWEESVVASRRSLLASKAARWPDLGLSVSYSRGAATFEEFRDDMSDDYSRSVSLSMSVPIFNGLSTKASIDNSRSALRSYEVSLRSARLQAAYEIEIARLSVDEGRRSVDVAEQSVMQAEEDLKVSEERFRLRAASMLELIDARVAYSRARAYLVDARYNYEIAKAELKLALGL